MKKTIRRASIFATLIDLSCIISAMYSQQIVPVENSKKATKDITKIIESTF